MWFEIGLQKASATQPTNRGFRLAMVMLIIFCFTAGITSIHWGKLAALLG